MFSDAELTAAIPEIKKYINKRFKQNKEDILQDTLERVLIKRSTYKPSMPLLAYLKRVAFNTAIDSIRSERRYNNLLGAYSNICKQYQKPNQEETVQLHELEDTPHVVDYGLGYTLNEIAKKSNTYKTGVFKQIKVNKLSWENSISS